MTTHLLPTHPRFVEAGQPWNLSFQHRPAAIAEPTSVSDVVAAVANARSRGLRVAIQATGHGPTALADEQSLLLSLRHLDWLTIDSDRATATVGGGALWAPVLAQAQEHGLAPLLGSSPHLGAVGYSLGGGLGWLARRHGLAVDRVRRLTVVLADGAVVVASPSEHTELFWALLGAGAGSLGVVVEMETELVPVTDVYAGNLFYPIDAAAAVFDRWCAWIEEADADFTSSFLLSSFPDLDIVPPPLRGRSFTIVRGCHCGDPAEGAALVDRWRAWREPVLDFFAPTPFRQMAAISQDPVDPLPALTSGRWLQEVDRTTFTAISDLMTQPGLLFSEIRHVDGALAQPNPAASFAAREGRFTLEGVAITPTPEAFGAARAALDRLTAATTHQHAPLPGYLNFVEVDERRRMVERAFGAETRRRLSEVKRAVDPDDVFGYGLVL